MWHMCMILGRPSQAAGPLVILDLQLAHSLCCPPGSLLRLIFRTSLWPVSLPYSQVARHSKKAITRDPVVMTTCFLPCRQGKPFIVPLLGHAWDAKDTDLYTTNIKACFPNGRKPVWEFSRSLPCEKSEGHCVDPRWRRAEECHRVPARHTWANCRKKRHDARHLSTSENSRILELENLFFFSKKERSHKYERLKCRSESSQVCLKY